MSSIREQREKADRELGITASYQAACEAREHLGETQASLIRERMLKRELEGAIEMREADVTSETWADNPDMPVTRLDKLVKVNVQQDPMMRELRYKLMQQQVTMDTLEFERAQCEAEIRIQSARMIELQGYLNFTVALMQGKTKE